MKKRITNSKLTTNLWFNKNGEEAVDFYLSVFKNSQKGRVAYYTEEGFELHGMTTDTPMTIEFALEGQEFVALNGGPHFQFSEAISFIVNCETQEEVDYYWEKLGAGGDPKAQVCGWLKDRFGVSWQIVPDFLTEIVHHEDKTKVAKVMNAMFKMEGKLDLAVLKAAFEG
ncbi:VOC family protein [Chitinophaga cymbidii]|uniref:VOC family protein n=1 Tax=Chitinophaga cymbidii TaxID=1096750 RepID=A0A512RN33_9BACT|nr:VOC family protein [Chitinophaga cymbidii]GEP97079.1 VOC family protein [Chitinophaga cymbidii]